MEPEEFDEIDDDSFDDEDMAGDECGRWSNGRLMHSCTKAGSEECDFECPYRATLRFLMRPFMIDRATAYRSRSQ